MELDMLLTCKVEGHVRETLMAQLEIASSPRMLIPASRGYYLSDYGFSRIARNGSRGTLQVSERASEDVKVRAQEQPGRRAEAWEQIEHMLRCPIEDT
ncbi:hypothetical protein [Marinimicrococcus flavescens]|uniref:Uncharacterized protein n=1 Tax=Marinimicrococcus flavescens TaxID=3031815 RepID=A0AAP4D698_9PROT|nr:hypothetical protein [Marinimicrococcus flavescens]